MWLKDETLRATLIESYHFEALVGDLIASGMEPDEARRVLDCNSAVWNRLANNAASTWPPA